MHVNLYTQDMKVACLIIHVLVQYAKYRFVSEVSFFTFCVIVIVPNYKKGFG